MKRVVFLTAILMIFLIPGFLTQRVVAEDRNETEIKIISVEDANTLIQDNKNNPDFMILDVRTKDEFNSAHIINSQNIDYKASDFKNEVSTLDMEKIYITYCRSGRRSAAASEIMKEMGFENIYMIDGGIIAWDKANLPTIKNK